MTREQRYQLAVDVRGYLVGSTWGEHSIGEILPLLKTDAFVKIVAHTDANDLNDQRKLWGWGPVLRPKPYHYRVIAE